VDNTRKVITLLSDFGEFYPASMKGVIMDIAPDSVLVDITHAVPPQDIVAGAFALQAVAPYFPQGTVHLAVVDPGVGTRRACMVASAGGHVLVGPDNGLLLPAARALAGNGMFDVFRIDNWDRLYAGLHPTFHGRDVFAPAAAHLALDDGVVELSQHPGYADLDFGEPLEVDAGFKLQILYIDYFGNLVTNAPGDWVEKHLRPGHTVKVDGIDATFELNYADAADLAAILGSHGYLEFAVRHGNASRMLGKSRGDSVTLKL